MGGGGDDPLIIALSVLIALVLFLIMGAVFWIYVQRRQRKRQLGVGVDSTTLCSPRQRKGGFAEFGEQVGSFFRMPKARGAAESSTSRTGSADLGNTVELEGAGVLEAIVSLEEQEQASMYEIALERIAHINQALAERSTSQAPVFADVGPLVGSGKARMREVEDRPADSPGLFSPVFVEQVDVDTPGLAEQGSSKQRQERTPNVRYDLPPPPIFSARHPVSDSAPEQATPLELSDSHSPYGETPASSSSTPRPSVVSLSALGSVSRAELARMMRTQHAPKPALALSAGPSASTGDKGAADKGEKRASPHRLSPTRHSPRPVVGAPRRASRTAANLAPTPAEPIAAPLPSPTPTPIPPLPLAACAGAAFAPAPSAESTQNQDTNGDGRGGAFTPRGTVRDPKPSTLWRM